MTKHTFSESVATIGSTSAKSGLVVIRSQEITEDFMQSLEDHRAASRNVKMAEHELAASVPTSVVDLWIAQGIPFFELSARDIVQRLRRDNLDAFIATERAV